MKITNYLEQVKLPSKEISSAGTGLVKSNTDTVFTSERILLSYSQTEYGSASKRGPKSSLVVGVSAS